MCDVFAPSGFGFSQQACFRVDRPVGSLFMFMDFQSVSGKFHNKEVLRSQLSDSALGPSKDPLLDDSGAPDHSLYRCWNKTPAKGTFWTRWDHTSPYKEF